MEERSERIALRRARSARIVARVREILPSALAAHSVVAAYVYGSGARGTALPTSDIDIAVVVIEPMTLSPYEQLTFELELQANVEDAARAATSELPPRKQQNTGKSSRKLTSGSSTTLL